MPLFALSSWNTIHVFLSQLHRIWHHCDDVACCHHWFDSIDTLVLCSHCISLLSLSSLTLLLFSSNDILCHHHLFLSHSPFLHCHWCHWLSSLSPSFLLLLMLLILFLQCSSLLSLSWTVKTTNNKEKRCFREVHWHQKRNICHLLLTFLHLTQFDNTICDETLCFFAIFFSRVRFGAKPAQKEAFKRFCLKKTRHTLF